MIGSVKPASEDDIQEILRVGLRNADLAELTAIGTTPDQALWGSFYLSDRVWTILVDGNPCAVFGVAPKPDFPSCGIVWLLGTADITRIHRQFLRESTKWLETLGTGYVALTNRIHVDNHVHVRWLKWLGFSFFEREGNFRSFAKVV